MATISNINPPQELGPEGVEFLIRLIHEINYALEGNNGHKILYAVPAKPIVGRTYYFGSAVAGSDISGEGLWIYKSIGWVLLG